MPTYKHRFFEIAACVSGILLIAAYVGSRAWADYASEKAIDAMQRARAVTHAPPGPRIARHAPSRTVSLSTLQPDTSTWSPKRLEEYRATLSSKDLPEAVLRIPKLALEVPVFHGTSDFVLNRGAGRVEGTAEASSPTGNIGIAAHRDGFFRPLKDITVGDEMSLATVHDTKLYRVSSVRIVDPSDVSVLEPTPDSSITLVTCYPFYYLGSAPKRFIVHARIVREALATDHDLQ
jgi:sortase A